MSKKKNKKTKKSSKSTKISDNPRYLRRRRVSPLKVVFWAILALLAGFVIYVMYRFFFDKSFDINLDKPETSETKELKSSSKTPKEKSKEDKPEENKTSEDDGKTPEKYDGSDPNESASLTGSFTALNKSGDNLVLRVNIDQYLSSGTCKLRLENGGNVVEKTANIFPTASTSSCEGFDVSLSELLAGNWKIILNLASGDKTGTITGEVSV